MRLTVRAYVRSWQCAPKGRIVNGGTVGSFILNLLLFGGYLAHMRGSTSDAPCARERGAWLQPNQSLPCSKCVWRAGHRLNGETATADVGKGVAAEEHQVGVALIDPERDLSSVVGISKLYMSDSIFVPLKVGEPMVEHR